MSKDLRLLAHYSLHWLTALACLGLYLGIMLSANVPSWHYTDPHPAAGAAEPPMLITQVGRCVCE